MWHLSSMPLKTSLTWVSRSIKESVVFSVISDDKLQLRHAIYEQFTNILYAMHTEKNGNGHAEGDEVKIEEGVVPELMEAYQIEGLHLPSAAQQLNGEENRSFLR